MTLLDQKLICIALYRLKNSTGNEIPYVYTNPESEKIITHRDMAFVLGETVPVELQGDKYQIMEKEGNLELALR